MLPLRLRYNGAKEIDRELSGLCARRDVGLELRAQTVLRSLGRRGFAKLV